MIHVYRRGGGPVLTGLFMNFRVISRASGGSVAENTPTCIIKITRYHHVMCCLAAKRCTKLSCKLATLKSKE